MYDKTDTKAWEVEHAKLLTREENRLPNIYGFGMRIAAINTQPIDERDPETWAATYNEAHNKFMMSIKQYDDYILELEDELAKLKGKQ